MQILNSLFQKNKKQTDDELERKSYNPFLALTTQMGNPHWSSCDYHTLCKRGYHMNPVVYACIRMIAEGAARTPFILKKSGTQQTKHILLDMLAMPSSEVDGRSFRTSIFSQLLLSGNCYIDCGIVETGYDQSGGQRYTGLYVLRSDRMTVVTDKQGLVIGYQYQAGNKTHRYDSRRIMHLKLFSPSDDYYGSSPTIAAWRAIELHNEATIFQKALLDNSARPSGCLIYSGLPGVPNLTEAQFLRLKSELQEVYTGSQAAGRPMILEGGLDWKSMSLSPVDLGISTMRHDAARDIALAYGIPPMLLNIPGDNTYSNYQEAVRVFTRNTLMPMAELFLHAFAGKMSIVLQQELELCIDREKIAEQFTDHKT